MTEQDPNPHTPKPHGPTEGEVPARGESASAPDNSTPGEEATSGQALPTNVELHRLVQKLNSIDFDNLQFNVDQPKKGFWDFSGVTFWDMMNLLLVPIFLTAIAFSFQQCSEKADEQIAKQQRRQDLEIARNNREVQYLTAYLAEMSRIMLEDQISAPAGAPGNPTNGTAPITTRKQKTEQIIRAKTLTVLRNVDENRKGIIVRMLHEQGLIRQGGSDYRLPFGGANLLDVNLESAWLPDIDMSGAFLSDGNLQSAALIRGNLARADLTNADLADADLFAADLSEANLSQANLTEANLAKAVLTKADLTQSDLSQADLSGTNLQGTDLTTADLEDSTYTDKTTSEDVCFVLNPPVIRSNALGEILNINELPEPEKGWTLAAVVDRSEAVNDIDSLITQLDPNLLTCPTQFPAGFDPAQHDMILIQSLQDLPD